MQVSFISADSWKKKKKNLTHHFKEPGDNGPCDIHVDDVEKGVWKINRHHNNL